MMISIPDSIIRASHSILSMFGDDAKDVDQMLTNVENAFTLPVATTLMLAVAAFSAVTVGLYMVYRRKVNGMARRESLDRIRRNHRRDSSLLECAS